MRSAAALSQEALAERAGLSKRGISDIERGGRQAPRLETVRLLAEALALGEADRQALLTAARPALLAPGLPDDVPPLGVSTSRPGRLPVPPNRLVGRTAKLAQIRGSFCVQMCGSLTLTGPGGSARPGLR